MQITKAQTLYQTEGRCGRGGAVTPLRLAASRNAVEVAKLLIDNGATD